MFFIVSFDGEISLTFNNFIPSQTPSSMPMTFSTIPAPTPTQQKAQDSDDDFFKSLNDDFAEIVGGNA